MGDETDANLCWLENLVGLASRWCQTRCLQCGACLFGPSKLETHGHHTHTIGKTANKSTNQNSPKLTYHMHICVVCTKNYHHVNHHMPLLSAGRRFFVPLLFYLTHSHPLTLPKTTLRRRLLMNKIQEE